MTHQLSHDHLRPVAPDGLRRARCETQLLRRTLLPGPQAPRGWGLPDPPSGPWNFEVDQRYGPLTPLVLTRAAQLWQADDETLAAALDLALVLADAGSLGHTIAVATAAARPVGRRQQLERLRHDVHALVDRLTGRLRGQEHGAGLLVELVLGCLLADAVSDVADPDAVAAGRGPWLAVFEDRDHPDPPVLPANRPAGHLPGTSSSEDGIRRRASEGTTMARWVCDYCGETGRLEEGQPVERVPCPTCGEPVLPAD